MDYLVAKALTFGFEIFRCKMKLWQLQIQNTGKNLNMWMPKDKNASSDLTDRDSYEQVRDAEGTSLWPG